MQVKNISPYLYIYTPNPQWGSIYIAYNAVYEKKSMDIGIIMFSSIHESIFYDQLIGPSDSSDYLQHFSNIILCCFIGNQFI